MKALLGLTWLGVAIAWVVLLLQEADGGESATHHDAFGHLTALLVLVSFTLLLVWLGRGLGGLVVGKDGRVSTSKVQVALWTYAIGGAMMSLIAATWVGPDTGFDALFSGDFDFEPYLVLLGGPFGAYVSARALVGQQVARGTSGKPPGKPRPSQVLTDDSGNTDLVDAQYMLFNVIALAFFVGAFLEAPSEGFPKIPTLLYVLTGTAALGYVSNKAIASGAPRLTSVFPPKGPAGTTIKVFGGGLLFPEQPEAQSRNQRPRATTYHPVHVTIGGLPADVVDGSRRHAKSGEDRFGVVVPQLPAGPHDVVVLNFRGVASEPVTFDVVARRR